MASSTSSFHLLLSAVVRIEFRPSTPHLLHFIEDLMSNVSFSVDLIAHVSCLKCSTDEGSILEMDISFAMHSKE